MLERRKGLLGRNRVAAIAGGVALIGIAAVLTGLLFAALANLSASHDAPPHVTAVSDGRQGLQVIRADPLELPQVLAFLSVPGRVAVNAPPEQGSLALANGTSLAGSGTLTAGDSIRVCVLAAAPVVELTLVDAGTGSGLGSHVIASPPVCAA